MVVEGRKDARNLTPPRTRVDRNRGASGRNGFMVIRVIGAFDRCHAIR